MVQQMDKKDLRILIIAIIISTALGSIIISLLQMPSAHQRIREYYETVNLVEVSPHLLISRVKEGEEITIVDVRDPGAYATSHIPGAINIPAGDPDLVSKFAALDKNKTIVTYCYTADCMASRQVGKILVEHGIFAQHLDVGYAEWEAIEGTGNVFSSSGSGACPLTGSVGC